MKRGVFVVVLALALVAVVGGSAAIAQDVTIVNMPFKFTVANKVMNPGKYEVRVNEGRTMITVTPEKGSAVMVPAITRLGMLQQLTEAKLVFDKVGDLYTLSELWLPAEDGYLVHDTKQLHQHHVVTAEKKKT